MQLSPMIKIADAPPQLRVCPALTKVLCFVPCLGNGGAEMHLARLLTHFDRTEFQPMLARSEEHTSELQSRQYLVCRLLLEKKNRGEMDIEGLDERWISIMLDRGVITDPAD